MTLTDAFPKRKNSFSKSFSPGLKKGMVKIVILKYSFVVNAEDALTRHGRSAMNRDYGMLGKTDCATVKTIKDDACSHLTA